MKSVTILSQSLILCAKQTVLIHHPAEEVGELAAHAAAVATGFAVVVDAEGALLLKPRCSRNVVVLRRVRRRHVAALEHGAELVNDYRGIRLRDGDVQTDGCTG